MRLALLLACLPLGCCTPAPLSSPPPCPAWDGDAVLDYVRLLEAEDRGDIQRVDAMHDWMSDVLTFCRGLDAYRGR